jgi:hypothetical protein
LGNGKSRVACPAGHQSQLLAAPRRTSTIVPWAASELRARHAGANDARNRAISNTMPKIAELCEKLLKIGAKVISHGRYVIFHMADVAVPRQMFADTKVTAVPATDRQSDAAVCFKMRREPWYGMGGSRTVTPSVLTSIWPR